MKKRSGHHSKRRKKNLLTFIKNRRKFLDCTWRGKKMRKRHGESLKGTETKA
jgi:hypothetical protein